MRQIEIAVAMTLLALSIPCAAQTVVSFDGRTYMCYGVAPNWTTCDSYSGKRPVQVIYENRPKLSDAVGELADKIRAAEAAGKQNSAQRQNTSQDELDIRLLTEAGVSPDVARKIVGESHTPAEKSAAKPIGSYAAFVTLASLNGAAWRTMSEREKALYVAGVVDGSRFLDSPNLVCGCAHGNVVTGVNAFYDSAPEYEVLPIPAAVALYVQRSRGVDPKELESCARALLRKIADLRLSENTGPH